jgi:hypothetical protein
MSNPRYTVSIVSITDVNGKHKARIAWMKNRLAEYLDDPYRVDRLEAQECVVCFRDQRQSCARSSSAQCAFCDAIIRSGNSVTDILCLRCAQSTKLCKHCGADIDLKDRRKRVLPDRSDDE